MIVAGFGFRGAARAESLREAYDRARGGAQAALLATAADKADSTAFRRLADMLGLPATGVPDAELAVVTTATQSAPSLASRGVGSLAEAAALAAVGAGGRLLAPRAVSSDRMATCALAETSGDLE